MAVEIPIPWPASMSISALPRSGDVSGWRKAFTEVSRKAYAAVYDDAIPPEYEAQQQAPSRLPPNPTPTPEPASLIALVLTSNPSQIPNPRPRPPEAEPEPELEADP